MKMFKTITSKMRIDEGHRDIMIRVPVLLLVFFGLFFGIKEPVSAASTREIKWVNAGFAAVGEASTTAKLGHVAAGFEKIMMASEDEAQDEVKDQVETGKSIDNLWGYTNLGIAHVDNYLNVREAPGDGEKLVGKLTKDAACEILSEEDGWYHIKSGKVDGYVSADYLLTGEEAIERAKEVVFTAAIVTTQTLKVRDEPNTDSPVITLVAEEEKLQVVELGPKGWAKIMLDDEEAYVSTDYVRIEEELETAVTMKELMYGGGVSDTRVDLVQYAKQFLGNPYVWGGTSLTNGADCSGFVQSIYRKFGVSLPRTSGSQSGVGTKVSLADAQPGDLIFYAKGGSVNHVAIYIGNGQIIHASNPKSGIKISNATYRTPAVIRRVLS